MNQLFLFLFSLLAVTDSFASSCCVSNTSISNLMILPSKWQQSFSLSQTRIIGDVNEKGSSTFRRSTNKDQTNLARVDLSYGWSERYQSGVSVKYQDRTRKFYGESSDSAGWSDVGLSHAWKMFPHQRLWAFQTLNIPTARSAYDSNTDFSVDARGTGTYQTSLGAFGIINLREWDFLYSAEVHRSFARTIRNRETTTEVGAFWGTSASGGVGYIPWRSKGRYGISLSPRLEGSKSVTVNKSRSPGASSLVWDSSLNYSYTINAQYSLGLNYIDQTILGPAKNTLLGRTVSFVFQTKWE